MNSSRLSLSPPRQKAGGHILEWLSWCVNTNDVVAEIFNGIMNAHWLLLRLSPIERVSGDATAAKRPSQSVGLAGSLLTWLYCCRMDGRPFNSFNNVHPLYNSPAAAAAAVWMLEHWAEDNGIGVALLDLYEGICITCRLQCTRCAISAMGWIAVKSIIHRSTFFGIIHLESPMSGCLHLAKATLDAALSFSKG